MNVINATKLYISKCLAWQSVMCILPQFLKLKKTVYYQHSMSYPKWAFFFWCPVPTLTLSASVDSSWHTEVLRCEKQMSLHKDRTDYTLKSSPFPAEFNQQNWHSLERLQRQIYSYRKESGTAFVKMTGSSRKVNWKGGRHLAYARKW